jgi:oligopeptide/dipeptide ABC transporter ATP-binding protein
MNESGALLRARGLKTYFQSSQGTVRAVDGVDLDVYPGEAVGLVGESGCGKTTTAHSIMKLVPTWQGTFYEGEVWFRDVNLLKMTEHDLMRIRGRDISIIFQDPMTYLNPVMRIKDQIAEVLSKPVDQRRVIELLERVGIPEPVNVASRYPHELSGGMRQRVLIAIAVANNPRLLIADEPTTALDVTIQAQILDLIRKIRSEQGTALLLITHDLGVVAEMCDRVYVMYAGNIVESGDVFSIFADPQHPYTQGLLRSSLTITERREHLETIEGVVPNLISPPSGCKFHPRCPAAMPICSERSPSLIQVGEGRQVSCWLHQDHE